MTSDVLCRASGFDPAKLAMVGPALQEFVDRGELAGIVSLTSHRGEIVQAEAIGWRDIETKSRMRPDTLFRIASMTKPITSVAALMLVEQGRIALADPISRWVPELANPRVLRDAAGPLHDTVPVQRAITIEDLLTHRSGVAYAFFSEGPLQQAYERTLGDPAMNRSTPDEWLTDAQRQVPFAGMPLWQKSGFGLGLSIAEDPIGNPYACGAPGSITWPGIFGTWWQADPVHDLIMIYLIQHQVPVSAGSGATIATGRGAAGRRALLAMDLGGFNVRQIPRTAAKAHQQALSLPSIEGWLYQVLQDGAIEQRAQNGLLGAKQEWQVNGLMVGKDLAYAAYEGFSSRNRDYKPAGKSNWSKRLHAILGSSLATTRITGDTGRTRSFQFGPLGDCRQRFAAQIGADFEWDPDYSVQTGTAQADEPTAANPGAAQPGHTRTPDEAAPAASAVQPSDVVALAGSVTAADQFIARSRS